MTGATRRHGGRRPGRNGQLRALLALRWRMVRSTRSRVGLALAAPGVLLLAVAAVVAGAVAQRVTAAFAGSAGSAGSAVFDVALLAPTIFLGFAALAIAGPLTTGGGELFPAGQLVAYPVTPRTHFLASLLLAPLNLVWIAQLVVLLVVVAYITRGAAGLLGGLATTLVYVALVTCLGQAAAWVAEALRATRRGRRALWVAAGVTAVAASAAGVAGHFAAVLDRAPTTAVVASALTPSSGRYLEWGLGLAVLLALCALALVTGERACAWALRLPGRIPGDPDDDPDSYRPRMPFRGQFRGPSWGQFRGQPREQSRGPAQPAGAVLEAAQTGLPGSHAPGCVVASTARLAALSSVNAQDQGASLLRLASRARLARSLNPAPCLRGLLVARTLVALVRVDRASVWRSAPLRRGAFISAILPGAVAALAALRWDSLILLPGLVAAGSGLLFGVNVFCLDAGGATWLTSLPHPPWLVFAAKTLVLTEFCALCVGLAVVAGAVRAPAPPTWSEVAALVACSVVCVLVVVATCLRLSVNSPHRAELRARRDTPAPPEAMVRYSVRLAALTTPVALLFSFLALVPSWWVPAVATLPLACLAILSLLRTARQWTDSSVRFRVVATVAAG